MRRTFPIALIVCVGCHLGEGAELRDALAAVDGDNGKDSAADVVEAGEAGEAGEADDDADDTAEPRPGPLTFVLREAGITAERMCDFDGDGIGDNAVAELGGTTSSIFVGAVNSMVQASVLEGFRWITHMPWVDDAANLSDPDLVALLVVGCEGDCSSPVLGPEAEDDFDGDASFYASVASLDPCGEPRFHTEWARLERGRLEGYSLEGPLFMLRDDYAIGREVTVRGRIEANGRSAELQLCSYSTIADLAAASLEGLTGVDHLPNLLALLLAGGASFGMPFVPGVQPDVDLDGDGVERLILDAEWQIDLCVDGDDTVIEGRDCWSDPRMADAFAITSRQDLVSAVLLGRQPRWEYWRTGSCTDPPETSLFDPR